MDLQAFFSKSKYFKFSPNLLLPQFKIFPFDKGREKKTFLSASASGARTERKSRRGDDDNIPQMSDITTR